MSPAKIKLNATTGGGSVSLEAPSSTTGNANVEFKLPVADGVGSLVSDGSGNLSIGGGSGGSQITKDVTLASGASTTNAKIVSLNSSGQVDQYPTMSTFGTTINDTDFFEPNNGSSEYLSNLPSSTINHIHLDGTAGYSTSDAATAGTRYSKHIGTSYRVKYTSAMVSGVATLTITGQTLQADGTYQSSSTTQTITTTASSVNTVTECVVQQWKENYWMGFIRSCRNAPDASTNYSSRYNRTAIQMFTVDPSTGAITLLGSKSETNWRHQRGSSYPGNTSGEQTRFESKWNVYTVVLGVNVYNGVRYIHYKATTSGISITKAWYNANQSNSGYTSATTYPRTQAGIDDIYAAERCRTISGGTDRSIALVDNQFVTHDFHSTSLIQTQISSTNLTSGTEAYDTSSGEVFNIFISATHFLHAYKDVSGKRRIKIFSTDGAGGFSQVTDHVYEDTASSNKFGKIVAAAVKSATEIIVYFDNGSGNIRGLSSISLNSSYVVQGIKDPIRVAGLKNTPVHQANNVFYVFNTNTSGGTTVTPFTVNSYVDTRTFSFSGVAQQTATSGTATICFAGIATGFSGLSPGQKYYVSELKNGDITLDSINGTIVGTALSATELLVGDVRT